MAPQPKAKEGWRLTIQRRSVHLESCTDGTTVNNSKKCS